MFFRFLSKSLFQTHKSLPKNYFKFNFSSFKTEVDEKEAYFFSQWKSANYEECLRVRMEINEMKLNHYKTDYPEISEDLCKLGVLFSELGEFDQALINFKTGLSKLSKSEENKILEADLKYNMSICYMNKDELDKSIEFGRESLKIKQELRDLFGNENKDGTSIALGVDYYHLAHVYWRKGEMKNAVSLFEKASDCFAENINSKDEQISKESIMNLANIFEHLGNLHLDMGNFEESLKALTLSKDTYIKIFGNDNFIVARAENNLTTLFLMARDYELAENSLKNAKRIIELNMNNKANKIDMGPLLSLQNNSDMLLARLEFERGNHEKAKEIIEIIEKRFSEQECEDLTQLHMFHQQRAQILIVLNEYEKAFESLKKGLELNKNIYGDAPNSSLSNIYNLLTNAYMHGKKDYQKAHEYVDKAYSNSKILMGVEDESCGDACKLKGMIFYNEKNMEKTIEWHKKAESIYSNNKKTRSFELETTLSDLANFYEEIKNHECSIEYLKKIQILKKEFDENSEIIKKDIKELDERILTLKTLLK